jgi:ubiquinone/menaquinone biosynthesis C-methylase UbiE
MEAVGVSVALLAVVVDCGEPRSQAGFWRGVWRHCEANQASTSSLPTAAFMIRQTCRRWFTSLAEAIRRMRRKVPPTVRPVRACPGGTGVAGMTESVQSAAEGSGAGQDANAVYALGSSQGESTRLQRQADELAPDSAALLDRVGLRPGQSAIDLGCGPRGILDLLARRVSPGGRVVGLDADPAHTAMAATFVSDQALSGVEVVTADARHTGLSAGSFDLVHARTLLVNVPHPSVVVAEMVRLAKPGGAIAVAEPDTQLALCYPPHPAFDRVCEIFSVVFSRNGADPAIGRRVSELFRNAGLAEVKVESRTQMYPPGNSRRTVRLDLVRAMRPQIVEMGLADGEALDELDAAARPHVEDPRTVVMSGLLFLVWGRKPA